MASARVILQKTLERPFVFAFTIGTLYFGYIFFWIWSLYPLTTVDIFRPWVAIGILFLGYSGSVLASALFWGLFGFLAPRFMKRDIALSGALLSALFVILEYARSWIFGILWWRDGSTIGPHWTFGNIAYWFADIPFINQTAAYWGMYGVEFIFILIVATITLSAYRKTFTSSAKILLTAIFVFHAILLTLVQASSSDAPLSVSLVQTRKDVKPDYTVQERLDYGKRLLQLLSQTSRTAPAGSFIVLPEGSSLSTTLSMFLSTEDTQKYFQNLTQEPIYILDNLILKEGEQFLSKTLVIHSKRGIVETYVKEILSPWGEFVPALVRIPLGILKSKIPITELEAGSPHVATFDDKLLRIIVCSDVFSPSIIQGSDLDLILGSSNLAFFRGNKQLQRQIQAAAQFRALENGKDLAWAVNFGQSFFVNSQGKVTHSTQNSEEQILTAEIIPNKDRTWYNQVGDWPLLVLSFALLLVFSKTRS